MMGQKLFRLVQIILTPLATVLAVLAGANGGGLIRHPQTFRLLGLVREVRELLARPENDFSSSAWADRDAALTELDHHIAKLEEGETDQIAALKALFAPTGSIQEVSITSGWGQEFLKIAAQFDVAARGL